MRLQEMTQFIFDETIQRGATDTEVYFEENKGIEIKIQKQKVDRLLHSNIQGVGVRILKDNRMGFFATSQLTKDNLREKIERVIETMRFFKEDPELSFAPWQKEIKRDLDLFDRDLPQIPLEDKVAYILGVEKKALDFDPKILTDYTIYIDEIANFFYVNTNGVEGEYQATLCQAICCALTKAEGIGTEIGARQSKRYFKDLISLNLGERAARKAIELRSRETIPPQKLPVVFEPELAADFLSYYIEALSAENIQEKSSFLIDKKGKILGSPHFTLIDDGLLSRGVGTSYFDGEGVVPTKKILINRGKIERSLYDLKSAAKDGVNSTGNATRTSYRMFPQIGATNCYLENGNTPSQKIIESIEKGIYLYSFDDTGGVNITSGDFSVEAKGRLIKNGKLTVALNNLTLASDLISMMKNLTAKGDDLTWYGNYGSPTMRIDEMIVSG